MTNRGYTLFDTALGRCGIAWSARGVAAVQLPEADERKTRARLLRRCAGATETTPPPEVRHVIDRIIALLRGEADDLADVVLDMDGVPDFNARIYAIARTTRPG